MSFEPLTIIRLSGIAGIFGGLIMAVGDLFYHHIPGSKQSLAERMSSLPQSRQVRAGIFGLVGSWFYLLSAFHLYYAFLPVGDIFALVLAIAFAMVASAYGTGHAAFYAIWSGAKIARDHGLDIDSAGRLGEMYYSRLVLVTYVPVAVASLLMLYGVFSGRSAYPLWMAPFLPIVLYLLRVPILKLLRGRLHELVRDSYDNSILLVFFLLSTILLWN
jgi:hypothetical protein